MLVTLAANKLQAKIIDNFPIVSKKRKNKMWKEDSKMKVGFISLGCSKNLVDTERMIGLFEEKGFQIENRPEEADILVINTCGFIESAKKEAIDTILEMAEFKKQNCKILIVTGCLAQRYQKELPEQFPEVDLFIPIDQYNTFWEEIEKVLKKEQKKKSKPEGLEELDYQKRKIATSGYYAYLKIAEGCSNHCTYCAIPKIRGPYVSRKMEDILEEAQKLSDAGVEELIVIAQDTTKYGIDLYGEPKLALLLRKLCAFQFKWIRFLYAYPETITDELIKTVKEEEKICHYFDIPIQHIADPVLKRMARKSDGKSIRSLIAKIRKEIPDVVLRTTLITGFPGETQEQFEELKQFVKEAKFERLGVFAYSKEDGTPAARLDGQLRKSVKEARAKEIMECQKQIARQNNEKMVGKKIEVLVENITEDGKYYTARSSREVPEDTDGIIYVENTQELVIGNFVEVKLVDALDYDFIAQIAEA